MFNPFAYFFGKRIATYNSPLSGPLEVWTKRGTNVLHSANANYSYDGLHRVFQKVFQAIKLKENPPQKVLLLGLGAGSVVSILQDELRIKCPIDAVEYDRMIIDIAGKHFNIQRFNNLTIHHADAYAFVQQATGPYNLIVVDVFNDNVVAERFFDEAFNSALVKLLSNGCITFNTIVNNRLSANNFKKLHDFYNNQNGTTVQVLYPADENRVLIVNKGLA